MMHTNTTTNNNSHIYLPFLSTCMLQGGCTNGSPDVCMVVHDRDITGVATATATVIAAVIAIIAAIIAAVAAVAAVAGSGTD